MLAQYRTDLNNLLQSPGAPVGLYSSANLDLWINKARGQIAGEGECVRAIGTITTTISQRNYNFSDISTGNTTTTGITGVIHVRRIHYAVASGEKLVKNKSWEWFDNYRLNNPVPQAGFPTEWAQYGQGSAGVQTTGGGTGTIVSGSFYIDPPPDFAYTLLCDCVCYPQILLSDGDVEAIPYLWTDAVPYFAAYLALMSAQTGQRIQEAQTMKQLYSEFTQRARGYATPAVTRGNFEQTPDPTMATKLGGGPSGGGPMAAPGGV
jgi:hypothetical protein